MKFLCKCGPTELLIQNFKSVESAFHVGYVQSNENIIIGTYSSPLKSDKFLINWRFFVGFERLPHAAGQLDPHWLELQRRYGPGALPPGAHLPGVYHPASIASDMMQRDRERLDRLGEHAAHNVIVVSRM